MADQSSTSSPPPKPKPSLDPGVIPNIASLSLYDANLPPLPTVDLSPTAIGSLDTLTALRILATGVSKLSDLTGDVPATPPVYPSPAASRRTSSAFIGTSTPSRPGTPPSHVPSDDIRSPRFRPVEIGSPEAEPDEPITADEATVALRERAQYDALARKFYSKKPPAIALDAYLLRLHRYCPMSTAVYLAAGAYILRLAIEERLVPVTPRTVHRLILAALRVAMKALEDLSYPHQRFAGVGGVSEPELAKLEVTLCYLMDFDLRVGPEDLSRAARGLVGVAGGNADGSTAARLRGPVGMRLRLPGGAVRNPVELPQVVC